MTESAYNFADWLEWMAEHATRRDDGRVTHLAGTMIPESHRNTIELWYEHAEPIPLGRWDEILTRAGLHLTPDFEQWLELTLGAEPDTLLLEAPLSPNTLR